MKNTLKWPLDRLGAGSGIPYLSLLVGFTALILINFKDAGQYLQYDRSAIAAGQFWRIFTAHWTHWSFDHFLWCTITFISLGAICERLNRKGFIVSLALSAIIIPVFCWFAAPAMLYYRGLSGLCSCIFVVASIQMVLKARINHEWTGLALPALAGLLFFAKTLFEFITGQTLFVESNNMFTPVPLAHLIGGVVGIITVMLTGFHVQIEAHLS